ncbi:MAG: molybdopterin-guanine dinucleotide biosynthesis protein B [Proteobacteria bacterium]|nr:molybdopterin-guanine dinucleotide biosynthesis protein B [Pseudomonadota bacterium]
MKRHHTPQALAVDLKKLPILGICGLSGAGKTTLIEALLPALIADGLRVAVVKHDCRDLVLDRPGKDSDRFYQAGGDVFLFGGEVFARLHSDEDRSFAIQLAQLVGQYDLILVEGHGKTPVAKLWLLSEEATDTPSGIEGLLQVLARDQNRERRGLEWIRAWLWEKQVGIPLCACLLIGGRSSRMGRPKHLITGENGRTWIDNTVELLAPFAEQVVLSGPGEVPAHLNHLVRLPDLPDVAGPLTGILAAMRWQPAVSWLLVACDMPNINFQALEWLLGQRRPGSWGTVPRLREDGFVEPLLAVYEPQSKYYLETLFLSGCLRISQVARRSNISTPVVPPTLCRAWSNINTPQELRQSLL